MSDLFEARQKTEEGASWRDTVTVDIDGEEYDLQLRQLVDPEFWEVMSLVDEQELQELQDDLPEDKMEEFRDLQQADDRTEEQEERLSELQAEMEDEDLNVFDALSYETYKGLVKAAKYGIEPDEADCRAALAEHAAEIEERYGAKTQENARTFLNEEEVAPLVERSTDFTSFVLGVKVLGATIGDEGN